MNDGSFGVAAVVIMNMTTAAPLNAADPKTSITVIVSVSIIMIIMLRLTYVRALRLLSAVPTMLLLTLRCAWGTAAG